MRKRNYCKINSSEITSYNNYINRRKFIKSATLAGSAMMVASVNGANIPETPQGKLSDISSSIYSTDEKTNSIVDVTTYNNFYEFGTNKDDPYKNSKNFKTRPWSFEVSGHAEKTGVFNLEDFIKPHLLEERIYRMRCVEAWSMVIPWVGIPLAKIVKQFKPLSKAKYVRFETIHDKENMIGQRYRILKWPYREGLTIAEATNPLSILAVGIYGYALPNQNGAPLRLIVPWKYGFKGIKSIVKMSFVERQPRTSWEMAAPDEYGF